MIVQHLKYDVCIVGGGIAGLTLALSLPKTMTVGLFSSTRAGMNASSYAQGGISTVNGGLESLDAFIEDVMQSGDGLADISKVRLLAEQSTAAIEWLMSQGVQFSKESNGHFSFGHDGGHCNARLAHNTCETGKYIIGSLTHQLSHHNNITIHYKSTFLNFVMEEGLPKIALIQSESCDTVLAVHASQFVLATGGLGGIFLNNSNPDEVYGAGLVAAWHAGCRVANLEFHQFHPTLLYVPGNRPQLVSETLRGYGALIRNQSGEAFLHKYHPKAEMATRDVVARAITLEMAATDAQHVYLDVTHKSGKHLKDQFSGVYKNCKAYGFDLTKDLLPVVPASHYSCGGIYIDQYGQTDCANLYALGECAYSGMHGANRLGGNSLLESVVLARLSAQSIASKQLNVYPHVVDLLASKDFCCDFTLADVQKTMWDYVGVIRSNDGLGKAKNRLLHFKEQYTDMSDQVVYNPGVYDLRNAVFSAYLTVLSAVARKESRGCHFNSDYPEKDAAYDGKPTIIRPRNIISAQLDSVAVS